MFYALDCQITIGDKQFDTVHEVEITTSGKILEDTAVIKLPSICKIHQNGQFTYAQPTVSVFAIGEEVVVKLGYNGVLREEFHGFVKRILSDATVSILCEDATFLLRKRRLNHSWQSVTVEQVIQFALSGTGVTIHCKVPTIKFAHFYLRDTTPAQVLHELIEKYGLTIYFNGFKTLYVGLGFDLKDVKTVKYDTGLNVISDNLEVIDSDDVQMRVKAVGFKPDGSKVEAEIGDGADEDKGIVQRKKPKNAPKDPKKTVFKPDASDGAEVRTLHFYNVHHREELKEMARAELRKRKFTGFKGGLTTFLIPFAKVGDTARLIDSIYQRGDGDYIIEKVVTTFGASGARRKVEIGLKVK